VAKMSNAERSAMGGRARAEKLSPERRSEIASMGARSINRAINYIVEHPELVSEEQRAAILEAIDKVHG